MQRRQSDGVTGQTQVNTFLYNNSLTIQQDTLGLKMGWDSVFIPINENHSHWYSAYINFEHKFIHIYDSWAQTCLTNQRKPVMQRKNTALMLVSPKDGNGLRDFH